MPIDLTVARPGDLFETRSGDLVEYVGPNHSQRYPHQLSLQGRPEGYTDDGRYFVSVGASPKDLVKGPLK